MERRNEKKIDYDNPSDEFDCAALSQIKRHIAKIDKPTTRIKIPGGWIVTTRPEMFKQHNP